MALAYMRTTPGLDELPEFFDEHGAKIDRALAGIPEPVYRPGHDPKTAAANAAAMRGLLGPSRRR